MLSAMVESPGRRRRAGSVLPPLLAAAVLLPTLAACTAPARLPPGDYAPREPPDLELAEPQLTALREDALARARVWFPPPVPIAEANLAVNPPGPGALDRQSRLVC